MAKAASKPPKRLPETYEEYNLAIQGHDYLNPVPMFSDEPLFDHPLLDYRNHGWQVRVETEAKARSIKHWLYVSNPTYGIAETRMNVYSHWQKVSRSFNETWIRNANALYSVGPSGYNDRLIATRQQVEQALTLLFVYCRPKNLSDYPSSVLDPIVNFGMFHVYDLFEKMTEIVDRSSWVDWADYWRRRALEAEDELRALKGLPPIDRSEDE